MAPGEVLSFGVLLAPTESLLRFDDPLSTASASETTKEVRSHSAPERTTPALSVGERSVPAASRGSSFVTPSVTDALIGEGEDCQSNSPPVAADDVAYAWRGQMISIDVLHNDSDPDFDALLIMAVTSPSQGWAYVSGTSVNYTAAPNATGSDSFAYRMQDECGNVDTGEVTIQFVDIGEFTLEREESDGSWTPVGAQELSWSHDGLRWTPGPTGLPIVQEQISWLSTDASLPYYMWMPFASAPSADLAIGNPGAGKWLITPEIEYSAPHQSNFFAQMNQPRQMDVPEIESIAWIKHEDDPAQAGHWDGAFRRFYPDATAPGNPIRAPRLAK